MSPAEPVTAAQALVELLVGIDRAARRTQRTIPYPDEFEAARRAFRQTMAVFAGADAVHGDAARAVLNPWLLRSRYWSRSYLKPHGYAGDYRTLEWIYDLERDSCADPTQPAVVNVLDGLFATAHSAVWHRRAWFARLIRERTGRVRLLDVACGGSRHVRDVLPEVRVEPTFVDEDPAALAFLRGRVASARLHCAPIAALAAVLDPADRFDVVICTVADSLDDHTARTLVRTMTAHTAPGGTLAICNFAPGDPSRVVKDWVSEWRLIYRDADALRALFDREPAIERSPDRGLIYARV